MKGFVYKKVILMVAFAVTFGSFNALAEEEIKPSASADVAVLSKYVWRGFELSDDSIVIQPSVTVEYKDFSFNLWGNLDTDYYDMNSNSDFNETDMTLSYATSLGPVDLDIGYIYYALVGPDTEEIYISAGMDTFLSPTLTVYRDFNEFQGWYMNFSLSHSIEIGNRMTLDLAGSAGYMDVDNSNYNEMHDGLISVGLTIPLNKYFTLSPMIAYSFGLSSEADVAFETGPSHDSDFFSGGVTLSVAF